PTSRPLRPTHLTARLARGCSTCCATRRAQATGTAGRWGSGWGGTGTGSWVVDASARPATVATASAGSLRALAWQGKPRLAKRGHRRDAREHYAAGFAGFTGFL